MTAIDSRPERTTSPRTTPVLVAAATTAALVAFASNSLLCRIALSRGDVDPATFTTIRLVSGAAALGAIAFARAPRAAPAAGTWGSAAALALYAVAFSYAYVSLGAGTGALLLFGAVQATMIGASLGAGERTSRQEWLGLACAVAGLVYLVSPGLTAPPLAGAALMASAGAAWAVYTVRGRRGGNPVLATAGNFLRAAPMAIAVSALALLAGQPLHATSLGIALALASGVLASGGGYVLWYTALPHLSSVRAASVQLVVPILGAVGGIVLLAEPFSWRLTIAAALIVGGVGMTLRPRG